MQTNKKFRPSKRYVFSTKESQQKLVELSKEKNGYELAEIFGCTPGAVYQALIKITKKRKYKEPAPDVEQFRVFERCSVVSMALGFKDTVDLIGEINPNNFRLNILPLTKKYVHGFDHRTTKNYYLIPLNQEDNKFVLVNPDRESKVFEIVRGLPRFTDYFTNEELEASRKLLIKYTKKHEKSTETKKS